MPNKNSRRLESPKYILISNILKLESRIDLVVSKLMWMWTLHISWLNRTLLNSIYILVARFLIGSRVHMWITGLLQPILLWMNWFIRYSDIENLCGIIFFDTATNLQFIFSKFVLKWRSEFVVAAVIGGPKLRTFMS